MLAGEEMQARTVGQSTRNRNLVIPAGASRSTFLCGLRVLCGEFFLSGGRRRWPPEGLCPSEPEFIGNSLPRLRWSKELLEMGSVP